MRPVEDLIAMVVIAALAFGAGYLLRACLGTVYVLVDKIPEPLRTHLQAASAEREITKWQEEGLLADVITEIYRQLKEEKIQNTLKEDSHGRSASTPPKDRA